MHNQANTSGWFYSPLDADQAEILRTLSKRFNMSRNGLIRKIITHRLDQLIEREAQ